MEESRNIGNVGVSPETSGDTFEQKVIRNVQQGGFAVFKTPEVIGDKTGIPNIEWEDPEDVDKYFAFAKSLGAKVLYVTEEEEEELDPATGKPKASILQIGFLYNGVMHHINFEEEDEDEDDDEEEYDEEEGEYEDEEDYEEEEQSTLEPQSEQPVQQQAPQQPSPQPAQVPPQQTAPQTQNTQANNGQSTGSSSAENMPWPKPQFNQ